MVSINFNFPGSPPSFADGTDYSNFADPYQQSGFGNMGAPAGNRTAQSFETPQMAPPPAGAPRAMPMANNGPAAPSSSYWNGDYYNQRGDYATGTSPTGYGARTGAMGTSGVSGGGGGGMPFAPPRPAPAPQPAPMTSMPAPAPVPMSAPVAGGPAGHYSMTAAPPQMPGAGQSPNPISPFVPAQPQMPGTGQFPNPIPPTTTLSPATGLPAPTPIVTQPDGTAGHGTKPWVGPMTSMPARPAVPIVLQPDGTAGHGQPPMAPATPQMPGVGQFPNPIAPTTFGPPAAPQMPGAGTANTQAAPYAPGHLPGTLGAQIDMNNPGWQNPVGPDVSPYAGGSGYYEGQAPGGFINSPSDPHDAWWPMLGPAAGGGFGPPAGGANPPSGGPPPFPQAPTPPGSTPPPPGPGNTVPLPPGGGGAPAPGGGTGTPGGGTPAPGTGGGSNVPVGTPDGTWTLDQILAWLQGPSGMNGLQYGPEVYRNLPFLQMLAGKLKPEDFTRLGTSGSTIPALGNLPLPAPGDINYTNAMLGKGYDPDGFGMSQALWRAGNRNLDAEIQAAGYYAPLGSAVDRSLIRTHRPRVR